MNPDKTIRVGDRVTVKRVPFGNADIHVGRTGIVRRIDVRDRYGTSYESSRYRFGGLAAFEIKARYVVEMEGVRKEQIFADAVGEAYCTTDACIVEEFKATAEAAADEEV